LVSGLGGGAYPCPAQGVGSADVSAGHRRIPELLQAVAAAGHGGLGPEFHGGGGGAAAVEPVATGGLISRMRFPFFIYCRSDDRMTRCRLRHSRARRVSPLWLNPGVPSAPCPAQRLKTCFSDHHAEIRSPDQSGSVQCPVGIGDNGKKKWIAICGWRAHSRREAI